MWREVWIAILNGQFPLQSVWERAELPRETVLILDNSGKNWTHDGGCTFGPTERRLMTHAWMHSGKLRVNTIRTQSMFAHTYKSSFPLLHQGAANTTELSKPAVVSSESRLCTLPPPPPTVIGQGVEEMRPRPKDQSRLLFATKLR